MEQIVIKAVDYCLTIPSAWWFASHLLKLGENSTKQMSSMVQYLLEIMLLDYIYPEYRPSIMGAAAFYLTNIMFNAEPWPAAVCKYTGLFSNQRKHEAFPNESLLKLMSKLKLTGNLYCHLIEGCIT